MCDSVGRGDQSRQGNKMAASQWLRLWKGDKTVNQSEDCGRGQAVWGVFDGGGARTEDHLCEGKRGKGWRLTTISYYYPRTINSRGGSGFDKPRSQQLQQSFWKRWRGIHNIRIHRQQMVRRYKAWFNWYWDHCYWSKMKWRLRYDEDLPVSLSYVQVAMVLSE